MLYSVPSQSKAAYNLPMASDLCLDASRSSLRWPWFLAASENCLQGNTGNDVNPLQTIAFGYNLHTVQAKRYALTNCAI